MRPWTNAALVLLTLAALSLAACSKPAPGPSAPAEPAQAAQHPGQAPSKPENCPPQGVQAPSTGNATMQESTPEGMCLECESVDAKADRAGCFKLRPGKTTKTKKGKVVTGRCEPQCIPYARCRSGINTCRLGDTSPVGWFQCAKKNNATSPLPKAGSIMVIDVNKKRKMPTGHLGYVEEACPNPDGTWTLRFSHTNYDRKCHLDLDAKVRFNPKTMEADFLTGHWSAWAKGLKICGFILR